MVKKIITDKYFEGIGRRKTAVARVRFFPTGKSGFFKVNDRDHQEYFDVKRLSQFVSAPLKVLDASSRKDSGVEIKVRGGGIMAQSEAVVLGLARALAEFNEDFRKELRVMGHLTRDPRRVERKKFGLKKPEELPSGKRDRMTQSVLRRNLILFLLFFLTLHFIAHLNGWYRSPTFGWVDIPIHFLAGVWVAAVFYWFFQRFPSHFDTSRHFWVTLLMVLGWAALIGVLWEFAEYSYDFLVAKYSLNLDVLQFGLRDTLGDLFFDLLGALALAIFVKLRYHK